MEISKKAGEDSLLEPPFFLIEKSESKGWFGGFHSSQGNVIMVMNCITHMSLKNSIWRIFFSFFMLLIRIICCNTLIVQPRMLTWILCKDSREGSSRLPFSIDPSFLGQDSSNELSYAQIRTPASKTCRRKHLLLYRCMHF